ncbi:MULTISPECIES: c-type cytochrome [Tenebrionibacter/Tenebrionicola group]|jgi:mono/diheme cytochrome c family protein|uniref:Cytochrome c n=2 Tax=Tenebrionibacter/Tenebrionicola group TaxID=2969848 RepID=A0A8K0XYD5_9ENTR|nr:MULTISPECIES: cytochrome c [Tenebrionibacter/Tenebrionicola group]MBK4714439.1 cytochrome c [Tenebrionibacter intestinalis]MBV5095336.1 cytochrome c [Tenebrionicola larvae]
MNKTWKTLFPLLALLAQSARASDEAAAARGEYLAHMGDCVACHSTAGGQPYAGGLKMSTPVGAIYSTNITPDKATGIGNYSYDDFAKALREGVAKDGRNLYPAMPYTSFVKIKDADMRALYAYFMQRVKPVEQKNRDTDIPWPLNIRWPLAVWNMLFAASKPFTPDPDLNEQQNRGAYLVQGLGHCGTCHTPRGIGFQEKALDHHNAAYLTGGTLEGWHAPNLTGSSTSGLGNWSAAEIAQFLKTGKTAHVAAFGSMTDVISDSTQYLSKEDVEAIAAYLKTLKPSGAQARKPAALAVKPGGETAEALARGDMSQPGAQEYMDNCAACHRIDGKGYANTFPTLAQNSAVLSDDPSSLISIVLKGGKMAVTKEAVTGLSMPDFGWRLDDRQVANVLTFIRNGWGNHASSVTPDRVKALRANITTVERKEPARENMPVTGK